MKVKNLFWGLFFLALAGFVIASQLGAFEVLGVWSVLEGFLILVLMIISIAKLNFFGFFLPAAFLYMIFTKPFGLPVISIWILLLVAFLLAVGFSIIFHKKKPHEHGCEHHGDYERTTETLDDNHPQAKTSWGASTKYLHADPLLGGNFTLSFGSLEVYFDQSKLPPEGSEVSVDCSFGEMKLYVPRSWKIVDKVHTSLGDFHFDGRPELGENPPCLTVVGNVQFGSINIVYI